MPASQRSTDTFASRVYVVGEVLVSLLALAGGFVLVFYSADEAVKLVGSGAISAVTAAWFLRRQNEHATNATRDLANDHLLELHEQQQAQRASIEALVATVAREKARG